MNKSLLLIGTMLLTASVSNAQELVNYINSTKKVKPTVSLSTAKAKLAEPSTQAKQVAPRKTAATGIYYWRPMGAMYRSNSFDGGYIFDFLTLAPFQEVVFENASVDKANQQWHLDMWNTSGDLVQSIDVSADADAEGNFYFQQPLGFIYPVPTLTNGTDSFTLGHIPYDSKAYSGNRNWTNGYQGSTSTYPGAFCYSRMCCDSVDYHSFVDENICAYSARGALTPAKTYMLDADNRWTYLFGSGKYENYTSYGARQFIEKPMSPLYVEEITLDALTLTPDAPIAEGSKLVMRITEAAWNSEENSYEDTGKVIAELECTGDDVRNIYTDPAINPLYTLTLPFAMKGTDALGSEINLPITIDTDCFVSILGFDDAGVDIDLIAYEYQAEDPQVDADVLLKDDGSGKKGMLGYSDPLCLGLNFLSCFDYAEPWTTASSGTSTFENFNVVKVSADGKTIANYGYASADYVGVNTAFPWLDHNEDENYYIDVPDWLTVEGEEGDADAYGARTGSVYLYFECEPLPTGVTGRFANLYIEGKGYKANNPIVVLQGDATLEEAMAAAGVEKVTAKGRINKLTNTYNLSGQRVGRNYKGIVVKDGKKYLK